MAQEAMNQIAIMAVLIIDMRDLRTLMSPSQCTPMTEPGYTQRHLKRTHPKGFSGNILPI